MISLPINPSKDDLKYCHVIRQSDSKTTICKIATHVVETRLKAVIESESRGQPRKLLCIKCLTTLVEDVIEAEKEAET